MYLPFGMMFNANPKTTSPTLYHSHISLLVTKAPLAGLHPTLLVVVWLAPEDSPCAVQLLQQYNVRHLMIQHHLGQLDLVVCPAAHLLHTTCVLVHNQRLSGVS